MGIGAALVGGSLGFLAQVFSNAIRKVPLSREPYLHVGMFCVGCWAGDYYRRLEISLVMDINEMRAAQGLLPMVGSKAWIRYQFPENGSADSAVKKG